MGSEPHADVVVRRGRPEDAAACGAICYEAFKAITAQHNCPSREVAQALTTTLLAHGDVYAVVAERDGRILGSNFLWGTASIAAIGPITVNPEAQNGAIGRRLRDDVLARAAARRFAGGGEGGGRWTA